MKRLTATLLLLAAASAPAQEVRDPMRPPHVGTERVAAARLAPTRVTGVFIAPERRAAIVDGRVVSAGQRVGLCLVIEILNDGVRCRFPTGERVVSLPGRAADVKQHTAVALAATGVPKP